MHNQVCLGKETGFPAYCSSARQLAAARVTVLTAVQVCLSYSCGQLLLQRSTEPRHSFLACRGHYAVHQCWAFADMCRIGQHAKGRL